MKINIVYGTESGGSELNAEDMAEALAEQHDVTVANMSAVDPTALEFEAFYILVCSTYGEGELPFSAQSFYDKLSATRPDLSGLRYAVFGRGDSSYLKTYSHGSEIVNRLFEELGGQRVGEYGRHDANDWSSDDEAAVIWATELVSELNAELAGAQS